MDAAHTVPQGCQGCQERDRAIERLIAERDTATAERDAAEFDRIWGIYKREGIERRRKHLTEEHAAVVIDLDDMHGANAKFGHDGVDIRVRKVMRLFEVLSGRWLRGDELVAFPNKDDAIGMAHRLLGALQVLDLSATIAVVWGITPAHIACGVARIEAAKAGDERGRIFVIEGGTA